MFGPFDEADGFIVLVYEAIITIDKVCIRVFVKLPEVLSDEVRHYHIVGVERNNKIAFGFLQGEVTGGGWAGVFLPEAADFIVTKTSDDIGGVVRRAIVNDDQFEVSVVLNENAFDGLGNIRRGVVGGHDHGNEGIGGALAQRDYGYVWGTISLTDDVSLVEAVDFSAVLDAFFVVILRPKELRNMDESVPV
jgi:hypothetical protein